MPQSHLQGYLSLLTQPAQISWCSLSLETPLLLACNRIKHMVSFVSGVSVQSCFLGQQTSGHGWYLSTTGQTTLCSTPVAQDLQVLYFAPVVPRSVPSGSLLR